MIYYRRNSRTNTFSSKVLTLSNNFLTITFSKKNFLSSKHAIINISRKYDIVIHYLFQQFPHIITNKHKNKHSTMEQSPRKTQKKTHCRNYGRKRACAHKRSRLAVGGSRCRWRIYTSSGHLAKLNLRKWRPVNPGTMGRNCYYRPSAGFLYARARPDASLFDCEAPSTQCSC